MVLVDMAVEPVDTVLVRMVALDAPLVPEQEMVAMVVAATAEALGIMVQQLAVRPEHLAMEAAPARLATLATEHMELAQATAASAASTLMSTAAGRVLLDSATQWVLVLMLVAPHTVSAQPDLGATSPMVGHTVV
jgi:hypothetical protein